MRLALAALATLTAIGISLWWQTHRADQGDATMATGESEAISTPRPSPTSGTHTAPGLPVSELKETLQSPFARFQTGDFDGAAQILRVEFARNPKNELLRKNLGTTLYALGLQKLREQKIPAAEDLFEEAAALDHAGAAAALANIRVRAGKHDAALAALEEVFEKTSDIFALQSLIDLALSRDDVNRAQAYLNRGDSLAPADADEKSALADLLAERRRRLEIRKAFIQTEILVERGMVQVAYNSADKRQVAEAVAVAMDETLENLSRSLVALPDQSRFRAIVIPQENFSESTGAPAWAQGIYDGILRIPVAKGDVNQRSLARTGSVARHETLHAYLHSLCGDIFPYWINEGLAQKTDGRPLSQAWNVLKTRYGRQLPAELPTDGALERSFINADPAVIDELYARSLILIDAVARRMGPDIWKNILSKSCVDREPLASVLTSELGADKGAELWKLHVVTGRN